MFKILKQLVEIAHERAMARKACRMLIKQQWSVEFLVALLCKARDLSHRNVYITLKNKAGDTIGIYADMPSGQGMVKKEKDIDVLDERTRLDALLEAAEVQGVL